MKLYLKHILTREITTNTHDCLVIILRIGTSPEAILILIKEEKKRFQRIFPQLNHSYFYNIQAIEKHMYIWGNFFVYKLKEQMQSNSKKKLNEITKQWNEWRKNKAVSFFHVNIRHIIYWIAQHEVKINCC